MKKIFTIIFLLACTFLAKSQTGTTVVISQVYGGGGNSSAAYTNDFIELFNPTSSAVALNGWSVQYAATAGTSWQVISLPDFSLQPGQYFLVQGASGGANGSALPTPDATGTINMSASNGKVALVNSTTALSGACPLGASVIDFIGFGTANCFEGTAAPTPGGNANSDLRASNGCTDANNNATDFAAGPANPRNSASPFNICGPSGPVISASPSTITLTSTTGNASVAVSYNIQGSSLSPASGNVTVTASADLEISLSSGSGFTTSSITIPYTGGTLSSTPVYVRIAATAPQGAFAGTVTNSGGGATDAVVTVNGSVNQNYYSKSSGNLDVLGTWGTATDGSGTTPADFSSNYQFFNVVNQANATIGADWDVAGTGSKVIVGNGTNATTLTVPANFMITSTTKIDVLNNATLKILNITKPFINSPVADGSTVDFAYAGTTTADTVRIPALSYYNLKLTNGLKFFAGNTTTIRGNLTADAVASLNGNGVSPFSTLNVFGNVTFLNNAKFEAFPAGDAGRFTLAMNGATPTQTITGNGTNLVLFRLRRDSVNTSSNIILGTGTNISLGNLSGGGLQLAQGAATTTTLTIGINNIGVVEGGVFTPTSLGKISALGGGVGIVKTVGTANAGTLRFTPGSALAQLGIDCIGFNKDSVTIADNIDVQLLTLTKGKIVVSPGAVLNVLPGGIINGGSDSSYVDGKLKQTSTVAPLTYPVGKNNKYAPVDIQVLLSATNSYTVQYFTGPYSTKLIDPVTLSTYPGYHITDEEYWTVDQATPGSANLAFTYTDMNSYVADPTQLTLAHFDGTDWNDVPGIPDAANTTTHGTVRATNVSTFSPFTFAARVAGVVPIKLEYIKAQKTSNGNALNWKVTCLSTNIVMELQRAADTRNFNSITTISASQERCGQPFDFTDLQPLAGKNFYRLKMIDADGKVSYSPVVAVINNSKGFEFVGLYPTIVKNETTLSVSAVKPVTIETKVTDMSGRVIKTFAKSIPAGSSLIQIDCSSLAPGIYNITSIADNTTSKVMRFIKN